VMLPAIIAGAVLPPRRGGIAHGAMADSMRVHHRGCRTAEFTTAKGVRPTMRQIELTDKLELLGVLAGAFLVVTALGSLLGTPWAYTGDSLVVAIQLVGVVATAAIGVGLAWLVYEPRD
jgi:hypothetical protein